MENRTNPEQAKAAIKVIGVGGGGGNALNYMHQLGICDVDFVICNTDSQALENSPVPIHVQLGSSLTEGRGAGNRPEVGKQAALENIEDVKVALEHNTKMVFITAGMGGGTGTGGAPVIAEACHALGYLTVGIVTIPFRNEGKRRIRQAIEGIAELENHVDALLVINNERIREMYGDFGISQAFSKADNVLATAAKGIAEIITVAGYINVDFADVETVMRKSGLALMGTGVAGGKERATEAVEMALSSPLLNNNDIRGAKNILLNITSGTQEVTMDEVGVITDYLQNKAGFEADLIWGNGRDESLGDDLSVTLIATGFGKSSIAGIPGEVPMVKESVTLQVEVPDEAKQEETSEDEQESDSAPEKARADEQESDPVREKGRATQQIPSKKEESEEEIRFASSATADNESLEFEVLYPHTAKERKKTVDQTQIDFSTASEEDLEALENIPAFKRRQLRMNDPKYKKNLSKYTISSDNKLSDRNSYLHNRVD